MLPRLRAEEALNAIQVAYAGNERHLSEDQHARYIDQLERAVRGTERARPASGMVLASMGIETATERKGGEDE